MTRLVVIGGGAAGMAAASAARRFDRDLEIVVVEAAGYASWGLCGIPYYLSGIVANPDDLVSVTPEAFQVERNIDLRLHSRAVAIDPDDRSIRVQSQRDETTIPYGRLVIASGARPVVPRIPGADHERVFQIRTLEDATTLRTLLDDGKVKRCLVAGAGYIGLEIADALTERGCSVTVVELMDRVMPKLDRSMASLVEDVVRSHVDLRLSCGLESIAQIGDELVCTLGDGTTVAADTVVLSVGVRPSSVIASSAGAEVAPGGALVVDDQMRTSLPGIFAAGDAIAVKHRVLDGPVFVPLGPTAVKTGRVAGNAAAGGDARFPGIIGTAVAKVFELTVARTGLTLSEAASAGIDAAASDSTCGSRARYYPGTSVTHTRFVYRRDGRLIGAQMASRDPATAKRIDVVAAVIAGGLGVEEVAELDLSYAPPYAPVYDPLLRAAHAASRDLKLAG